MIHNIIQLDKTEVSVNRQSDFPLKVSMKFVKNALESGRVPKQTCSQSAVRGVSTRDVEERAFSEHPSRVTER